MVRRYLLFRGDVQYVTNFTDVTTRSSTAPRIWKIPDLHLPLRRKVPGSSARPEQFKADVYPRVTNEIDEIITVIQNLGEEGYAYEMDGSVYFRGQR
ncbi:MAG: hypothetical protein R2856_00675 [Caldilineaceae bacterium]